MKSIIETAYSVENDMTFIMEWKYRTLPEEIESCECIGFYFGKPNEKDTEIYKHKLKAEF